MANAMPFCLEQKLASAMLAGSSNIGAQHFGFATKEGAREGLGTVAGDVARREP